MIPDGRSDRDRRVIPPSWWNTAALGLLLAASIAMIATGRGSRLARLIAMQCASTSTVLALLLIVAASRRPSYLIVPLALAAISVPGTLIFANVIQRWLRNDPCEA